MDDAALCRLLAWTSPAFPVGGYSYSHGLETAVAEGLVADAAGLREWTADALEYGAGRVDGAWLAAAHDAARAGDWPRFERLAADARGAARKRRDRARGRGPGRGVPRHRTRRVAARVVRPAGRRTLVHAVAVGLAAAAHRVPATPRSSRRCTDSPPTSFPPACV